jgi:hypothetical protein
MGAYGILATLGLVGELKYIGQNFLQQQGFVDL